MPTDYSYIGDLYGNPTGVPSGPGSQYGFPGVSGPTAAPTSGGSGILGTGITWRDILEFGEDAAPYILGGVGTISAIGQQNRANDLREEALGLAREDYASRDPLRQRALGLLTGPLPQPMDLSGLRDTANPFRPMNPPTPLPGIPNFTASLPTPPAAGGGLKGDRPPENPYYDPAVHGPLKSDRPATNPYFNPDAPYRRRVA